MKIYLPLCVSLSVVALAACSSNVGVSAEPFTAKIIALNDYHGNLESPVTIFWNIEKK